MKKLFLVLSLLLFSGLSWSQTGEELLQWVDSAYSEAVAGRLPEAIRINEEGLEKVPADSLGLKCEFYACLLYCYHRLGDYEQALRYGELCLDYDEKHGDLSDLSVSLGNLAGIYSSAGKHDVAISYLNRAILIEEELVENDPDHTEKSLAVRKAMLGEVLLAKALTLEEGARDSLLTQALRLTHEAYLIDSKLGRHAQVGIRLSQLGNLYGQLGDKEQAVRYNTQALEIARQTNNRATEVITLLQLERYEEAAEMAHAIGMKKQEMEACRHLVDIYQSSGRYKEALAMSERAASLSETMLNEETERQLTLWEVRYDTQQKEQQLRMQEQTIRIQRMRTVWMMVLIILALLALVLLVLYTSLQMRHKREIEANARAKDRYYAILSHDLKNPMIAQQMVLRMMYTDFGHQAQEDLRANLGVLLANSDTQIDLVSNLQEMTRLEQGKRLIQPARIDLAMVIKEVVGPMKRVAEMKGVQIAVKDEPSMAYADHEVVRTVLRNLLSNAIKFSNEGSVVEVGSLPSGRFYVSDSGTGMSDESVAEILNARYGVKSSVGTQGENGSGIGLVLCRELLALSHGRMEIQSELGKGSTFTVILPVPES